MPFNVDEIERLASAHFEGGPVRCPRCANHLYVKEQKDPGQATVDLLLHCLHCGDEAHYANPDRGPGRWESGEIRDIVESWHAAGEARCPSDSTQLTLQQHLHLDPPGNELLALCRRCGRFFRATLGEEASAFDR